MKKQNEFTVSLQNVIAKLEAMFSKFNSHFYNGELEAPVITVTPEHKNGILGWCTSWKAWKDDCENDDNDNSNENGYYEINLCSEYLSRPLAEIAETLLHEMIHLFNLQKEIKDTSRGGTYHNKRFKESGEQHGLVVEQGKSGWNKTSLTDEAYKWIVNEYPDEKGFGLYRGKISKHARVKSKSSSRKYICPECKTIIRATKEVNVYCGDCDAKFKEEL